MSYMYSLLNSIATTSKEAIDSSVLLNGAPLIDPDDGSAVHSVDTGLRGLTEDEKRLVGISTISVVTRLALEFGSEEVLKVHHITFIIFLIGLQVIRLTTSMLLQRLRSAEPTVEAAIAYNLVDLALAAPDNAFSDIIRAFSSINRSANQDDPRLSNNMVCQ